MANHLTPKNEAEQSLNDQVLAAFRNATPFSPAAARFQQEMRQTAAARERVQNRFNAPVAEPKPAPQPDPEPQEAGMFFVDAGVGKNEYGEGAKRFRAGFLKAEKGEKDLQVGLLYNLGTIKEGSALYRLGIVPMMDGAGNQKLDRHGHLMFQVRWAELRARAVTHDNDLNIQHDADGKRISGYKNDYVRLSQARSTVRSNHDAELVEKTAQRVAELIAAKYAKPRKAPKA